MSLFSCNSLDKVKDIDDKLSPELTAHLKKENQYSGEVFLDLIIYSDSYSEYLKVVSSEEELLVFSMQHEDLKKSKIVFEDFDFSEGNLLFLFYRMSVFHTSTHFIFESLEILGNQVIINMHFDSKIVGLAITSYL
ncbi:MAG: hypothetical protein LBV58_02835, partial [Acholeplasmatales bacterium]|nr:hypothetical protein [Acholeplasmatales bacterium]